VQYAHANFVVHRDLKPSNILVTVDGQVRLLDFGIAKLLDPEGTPSGVVPTRSLLLLTPEHAAPEQFLGQAITTATDVYQLGVLLYEMLAGTRPFQASTSHALHRAICDEEPTRPSAALGMPGAGQIEPADTVAEADAARARSTTPDSLRHQLRGDLDRIVLMALRKEPGRRYVSAADLADDIERHLGGYPVRARPESLAYVGGRFVRRHKAAVAAAVALAASLIALAVTSIRFAATTSAQAAAIAEERDVALEVSSFLEDMFAASDPFAAGPERRDTLRIRDFLDEGARNVRDELDGQPIVQARLFTILGRAYRNLGQFDEARPLLDEALTIRTREAGPESADVATSQLDLAQLLIDRGDHDQAEALLRSSLTILGRDSAKNVRRVASTFGILGNVLQEGGRYAEAEAAYRQALVLAETDSITDDGRRAEALFRESLDMRRALYGEQHPAVGIGWINLAAVLQRDQGRHEEAMKSYDEARTVLVATVGPRHPLLGAIDGNLGRLHHGNGEHDRAITHLRRARRAPRHL
jgi:serine/threonine-protein kinase